MDFYLKTCKRRRKQYFPDFIPGLHTLSNAETNDDLEFVLSSNAVTQGEVPSTTSSKKNRPRSDSELDAIM